MFKIKFLFFLLACTIKVDCSNTNDRLNDDLTKAIRLNNLDEVKKLISTGASTNAKYLGIPILIYTLSIGDTTYINYTNKNAMAIALINGGADVKQKYNENTVLMIAIQNKVSPEVIDLLLKKGAEVNAKNKYNLPVLYEAINQDNIDLVNKLISHGADVNMRHFSEPLLIYTLTLDKNKYKNKDAIAIALINAGADVNTPGADKNTPLMVAIEQKVSQEVIDLLLEKNAEVNAKNKYSLPVLYEAINQDNIDLVNKLISHGADVNMRHFSEPLLIYTLTLDKNRYKNKDAIATALINAKADVNEKYENNTPLMVAIEQKVSQEVIDLLLEKGAEVNAKNKNKLPALYEAISQDNIALVNKLISHDAHANATYFSEPLLIYTLKLDKNIYKNKDAIATALINAGANVNTPGADKNTPLMVAIEQKVSQEVIDLLLEKDAKVNEQGDGGKSPLTQAIYTDNIDIVNQLIAHGVDVNAKYGSYPIIHYAVKNINAQSRKKGIQENIVLALVNAGASLNFEVKEYSYSAALQFLEWIKQGHTNLYQKIMKFLEPNLIAFSTALSILTQPKL